MSVDNTSHLQIKQWKHFLRNILPIKTKKNR